MTETCACEGSKVASPWPLWSQGLDLHLEAGISDPIVSEEVRVFAFGTSALAWTISQRSELEVSGSRRFVESDGIQL